MLFRDYIKKLTASIDIGETSTNFTGHRINISTGNFEKVENGVVVGTYSHKLNSLPPQKILFIFAHPDDEQWQAGTIQQMIDNGHDVYVTYSTSGKYGTDVRGILGSGTDALRDAREAEAMNSLLSLGVPIGNITALRLDDQATSINAIFQNIIANLTHRGITIDCVISFDDAGVYGKDDHYVCGYVANRLYLEGVIGKVIRFTLPKSDYDQMDDFSITKLNNEGTDFAPPDYAVDVYYRLTAAQIAKKLATLDYHVTQFAEPLLSRGKNHYTVRPYEYFITGFEKLNNGTISTKEYLNLLLVGV